MDIVLITGLLSSVILIFLSFAIKRKTIIITSVILVMTTGAQFALLERWSTVLISLVTILYALAASVEHKVPWFKSKTFITFIYATYIAAFIMLNGLTLNIEILPLLASVTGLAMMTVTNPYIAKTVMLINGMTWLIYQISVGAYGQIPGELFFIFGVIFTLAYMLRVKSQGKNIDDIPEIGDFIKNKFESKRTRSSSKAILV